MTETVTITHHAAKPEYQWEMVVPEGPTVLLLDERLSAALQVFGYAEDHELQREIRSLPNGESRSVDADVSEDAVHRLEELGVKSVMQQG